MRAADIEPGVQYAVRVEPDEPLRSVTAIRAEGQSLIYRGNSGEEHTLALARVLGHWAPHAESHRKARAAAHELHSAQELRTSHRSLLKYAYAVEYDYADFRTHLTCTIEQAYMLAALIRTADETEGH